MSSPNLKIVAIARHEAHAYAGDEDRPLGSYLALMGGYGAFVGMLSAAVCVSRRSLPRRPAVGDVVLTAIATHKVARLLSKDPVTSPLRAPFTRFQGQSGEAEIDEQVRGTGTRKALGEVVTCPFCLDQWVATAFSFGLIFAPRATRFIAGVFTVTTLSDFLQLAYGKAQA